MGKKRNYTPETIQQIVDLHKSGLSVPAIAEKLSLPYTSVRAILIRGSINEPAPLPLNTKDIEEAYSFYNYCQISGFDSEATAIFCRQRQLSIDELKKFGSWYKLTMTVVSKAHLEDKNSQFKALTNEIGLYKQKSCEYEKALAQYACEKLNFKERQLESQKEIKDLKAANKSLQQVEVELELIKKVQAILGQ